MSILVPLILAVFVTLGSKMPLAVAQKQAPGGYDNVNPRVQQATFEGWAARAVAAHQNGWEAFQIHGVGAACVLAAGHDGWLAAALGYGWVGARILYTAAYVKGLGTLRSLVWSVGLACSVGLYLVALLGNP